MLKSVTFFVAMCGVASTSSAALIDLALVDSPKISTAFIDVTYNSATNDLFAIGFPFQLDMNETSEAITDGSFFLAATIDELGAVQTGGVIISTDIDTDTRGAADLLTGTLLSFGFEDAGGSLLQFLFAVTGGSLETEFGGIGGLFGVQMDVGGFYSGDWNFDFDNLSDGVQGTGQGFAETAPQVPAPGALSLGLLAGLALRRRR